jgi:hypothetical protein
MYSSSSDLQNDIILISTVASDGIKVILQVRLCMIVRFDAIILYRSRLRPQVEIESNLQTCWTRSQRLVPQRGYGTRKL